MKTTETGRRAEAAAAVYLEQRGLKILARNWRNRWCEIDLIGRDRTGQIHIIEVKYRATAAYGHGFEYVTAEKAERLKRAALVWTAQFQPEAAYQIDAVSVLGSVDDPKIEWLPNAI